MKDKLQDDNQGNYEQQATFKEFTIHDSESFAKSSQLSARADFSGWGVTASAKFHRDNKQTYRADTVVYMVVKRHIAGFKVCDFEPSFTQHAKKILQEKGPAEFRKAFGSHFVYGHCHGSMLTARFSEKTTNKTSNSSQAIDLQAKYSGMFSVEGGLNMQNSQEETSMHKETAFNCEIWGRPQKDLQASGIDPNNMNNLAKLSQVLAEAGEGSIFYYICKPYSTLNEYQEELSTYQGACDENGEDAELQQAVINLLCHLQALNSMIQSYPCQTNEMALVHVTAASNKVVKLKADVTHRWQNRQIDEIFVNGKSLEAKRIEVKFANDIRNTEDVKPQEEQLPSAVQQHKNNVYQKYANQAFDDDW